MALERFLIVGMIVATLCVGFVAGILRLNSAPPFSRSSSGETVPSNVCPGGTSCSSEGVMEPDGSDQDGSDEAHDATPTTSLLFVGDLMFDRTVAERIRASHRNDYPFSFVKQDSLFTEADLRIGNLEGPLTAIRRPPVKTIDFAFDPELADVLRDVGFDAVSQANNHALDQGREGALESRQRLQAVHLAVFGDQQKDDVESSMTLVEVHDRRIALIGFNITDRPIDHEAAKATFAEARARADLIIVMPHWGTEYRPSPGEQERALGHWFIDEGADAVFGSHPHWMQSIEVYRGRPIVYSLGNFVFDQDWSTETKLGLAVTLVVGPRTREVKLHPLFINQSRPTFLKGEERTARLKRLAEISDPALRSLILDGRIPLP